MKLPVIAIVSAGSIVFSVAAFAQSAPTPAAPAQTNSAAAVPVPSGKRMACQTASQALKGQDRQDQIQLCMAQARLKCLKQAIDQKIVGPQRKDFMQTCAN
ncbi:hypothetical protein [Bradyrhizobium sp. Ash2021]|uniref:hypothetical protein n=1 Tax=Bradyrhizobium sp. Ash2021 TaxID=2954771 RepID=UPI0028158B0C|nr:hypothetical protein [Bradyrhizobium sp. Ash2021]WMT75471.1 hypothetical protein NL528_03350 [Bradyrhizobium sp. Ash2021]